MKISSRQHASLHGIMVGRGLPRALVRASGELHAADICACQHAETRTTVTQTRQRNWLKHAMMDPTGDWLMVVGTRRDPDLIGLIGLEFFARATRLGVEAPQQVARPLWKIVVGGWGDRLRDDSKEGRAYREDIGRIGVLVLSGVTWDCPPEKLEKIRDLIHLHEGIPRMVLMSGGDPLQFGYDRLNRRPDRVVHVNRSHIRADRDIG